MIVPIKKINTVITTFESTDSPDFNSLAKILHKEIGVLTSSCTMTDKSHDELHKWLLPFIDLVDALSESTDEKNSEQIFQELKDSMSTYNTYFK